ncbi:MAG: hypothetical protein GF349_02945 [Candidatus Magasanikbacteria bacterium]|nr:hypothetical protein [Candidatus Magasanikbacteria bacterium]
MITSHYAFSDDSCHVNGRYNSLALVSLQKKDLEAISNSFVELLNESGIKKEFKWEKVKNAKYRLAGEKIINLVFKYQAKLRIDVVIWDLEDQRHKNIKGCDDAENLVRMYYHLVSTTLSRKWPVANNCWRWHPDKQSSVCWNLLQDCITTKKHHRTADLLNQNPNFEQVNLKSVIPSESCKYPLIQLADLFAGMGSYSYGHNELYKIWKNQNTRQISMFDVPKHKFSNGEMEKFTLLSKFDKISKENKLKIALLSTCGLKSHNPNCFVNFWPYTPQHKFDKAPTKIRMCDCYRKDSPL